MSKLAGKHVAGSLGGAAGTIAVPDAMRLRGWGDVMGGGAVAIDGDIAIKRMWARRSLHAHRPGWDPPQGS